MRLLLVSNRLPITVQKENHQLNIRESVGGLTSGLSDYLSSKESIVTDEYLWIGWVGAAVDNEAERDHIRRETSKKSCYPVFLTEEQVESFYHGFCNSTLWPLFHYFPSLTVYDEGYWRHYREANQIFCDSVVDILRPDDIVWIHDFHLMLLPRLLKRRAPSIPVGFFLHIPFPSFELFRLLPDAWRKAIIEGLLGADLLGFHTDDFRRYFLESAERTVGHESQRAQKIGIFRMGIDFMRYNSASRAPEVLKHREHLEAKFADRRLILLVSRLDYTKGIPNSLLGYEKFLEENTKWQRRVVLLLVIAPSRLGVDHYQRHKSQVDELVGRINSRFGDIDWTPIIYQFKFTSFHLLVAMYSISDVALVTSLRDGMNLTAKEYIAARNDGTGVLILSEMTGASEELENAIIVNPNSIKQITGALKAALTMPREEQIKRNRSMQDKLREADVFQWGNRFILSLLAQEEALGE
jgi:trehalose 6-phosphate synthase/phosphatase